ncbi:hypothetical protein [Streptomyces sp. MZ04]|nr:hypothetical protein [Streptomyces sp. MZ04]
MDAVDGGRSRRLPVLVRFGVGEGAVSAESAGRKVFGLAAAGVRLA